MGYLPRWFKTSLVFGSLVAGTIGNPRPSVSEDTESRPPLLGSGQIPGQSNDTTVLPDEHSIDAYWPVDALRTNVTRNLNNASTTSAFASPKPMYRCDGTAFGRNIKERSCLEALDSMNEYDLPQTFGERGEGKWDVNLPFRFLSNDGLCAIDVSHKAGNLFDTARPTELRLHAQALINICVRGNPNEGGVVTNLGENGDLAIRITPYRPNVQCKEPGSGPPPYACRKILDQMPADGIQQRFGPPSDPATQFNVPQRFTTPEKRCAFLLDTSGGGDVGDWYKIWAATVAVEVMCVEVREVGGVGLGLGKDRNLFVELFDLQPGRPWQSSLVVSIANMTSTNLTTDTFL